MPILKAYKYKLKPTADQKVLINKHFGAVRWVYNKALSLKKKYYDLRKKTLSLKRLSAHFTHLKKQEQYLWLNEINAQALQSALRQVELAYKSFFEHRTGFPRFKKKSASLHSYQNPQHVQHKSKGSLKLPKLGLVKFEEHRALPKGTIKTCTVSRGAAGIYEISLLVESPDVLITQHAVEPERTEGIDLGILNFAVSSDGTVIANPRSLNKKLGKLKKAQRILSRKQKGSANRAKQKQKVALVHRKVAQVRKNPIHQVSHAYANKNHVSTYVVEDLAIKNMLRNPKLARHISDCGWAMFLSALSYKLQDRGKNLIIINRWLPSSKECSACFERHSGLTLKERMFECPSCSHEEDRDLNAARNIRRFGLQQHFDPVGTTGFVKSSHGSKNLVKAREPSKGPAVTQDGSKEAPVRIALAI